METNRFASLPDHIDLNQCVHCQEYQMSRGWIYYEDVEEAVYDSAADAVEVSKDAFLLELSIIIDQREPTTFIAHVTAKLKFEDLVLEENLDTTIRVKRSICAKCNKIHGNYFESIIQLRTGGKKVSEEEKDELLNRIADQIESISHGSRDAFISKVVEEHGGFDVYVSTNALGKALARDLVSVYGAEYKESATLQGQKDGRDIYRVTYLVRLPPYRIRDVILYDSKPFLVLSMGPVSAKLRDLRTSETVVVNNNDLREVPVIGSKEDFKDAVVLTETEKELQLMHPVTYKTVEVKRPRGLTIKGDSVKVFSREGELYIIGN